MSSTNKTANLELNQWVGTDPVLMADFNADNARIDQAVKSLGDAVAALPRIATGSYVGSGKYGSSNPTSLTFPFAPKLVVILSSDSSYFGPTGSANIYSSWMIAMPGITKAYVGYGNSNAENIVSFSGNTMSWYATSANAGGQCNASNTHYYYVALG